METPLIAASARKHGVHDDGFVMFVGADVSGNQLEIGVIESVDGPIIIHAMAARPKYLR